MKEIVKRLNVKNSPCQERKTCTSRNITIMKESWLKDMLKKMRKHAVIFISFLIILGIGITFFGYELYRNTQNKKFTQVGAIELRKESGFDSEFSYETTQTMIIQVTNADVYSHVLKIASFQIQGVGGFDPDDVSSKWGLYSHDDTIFEHQFDSNDFQTDGFGIYFHGNDINLDGGFEGYFMFVLTFKNSAPSGHYQFWLNMVHYYGNEYFEFQDAVNWVLQ